MCNSVINNAVPNTMRVNFRCCLVSECVLCAWVCEWQYKVSINYHFYWAIIILSVHSEHICWERVYACSMASMHRKGSIKCSTVYYFLPFESGRTHRTWRYAFYYSHVTMQPYNICRSAVFNLSLVVCCLYCWSLVRCNWMIYALHDPKRSTTQNEGDVPMKNGKFMKIFDSMLFACKMICTTGIVHWALYMHSTGYLHSFCGSQQRRSKMWYRNISNYHRSIDNSNGILSDLDWFVHIICGGHIIWEYEMSNGSKTTTSTEL